MVRQLLLALLLACTGVALVQQPAQAACTCDVPSVGRAARQADTVFTGLVDGTDRGRRRVTVSLEVDTVFKGDISSSSTEVVTARDDCGLDPSRGRSYLVFATERRGSLTTDQCAGTTRARGSALTAVERVLGPGEPVAEPEPEPEAEPEPPEYTRVLDSDPPEFPRLAAPGAALALVGLLGWVVVRRRS